MNSEFIQEVKDRVRHKPRLTPIFTSTHEIPERVFEYSERMFLCYNIHKGRYEVHNLDQEETYCADLPYRSLDARTLRWIWKNDIRVHGMDIFRELDKNEEDMKKSKERDFRNWVESVGSETQSMFAKDAWMGAT